MTRAKLMVLSATSVMFVGIGGSCLAANFWSDKISEIVNGLIISALNLVIAPTGLAV